MTRYYVGLSGRRYNLSTLEPGERRLVEDAFLLFNLKPSWEAFSRSWHANAEKLLAEEDRKNPKNQAIRVCEDLGFRLAISEGRMAPPDYRFKLADLIEERFGSRYSFCKETGIDEGHLSKFLRGQRGVSDHLLNQILQALKVDVSFTETSDVLTGFLREEALAGSKLAFRGL